MLYTVVNDKRFAWIHYNNINFNKTRVFHNAKHLLYAFPFPSVREGRC